MCDLFGEILIIFDEVLWIINREAEPVDYFGLPGLSSLSQAFRWLLWLVWFGVTDESLGQGQCVSTIVDPKTRAHRWINAINLCAPVVVSPQRRRLIICPVIWSLGLNHKHYWGSELPIQWSTVQNSCIQQTQQGFYTLVTWCLRVRKGQNSQLAWDTAVVMPIWKHCNDIVTVKKVFLSPACLFPPF